MFLLLALMPKTNNFTSCTLRHTTHINIKVQNAARQNPLNSYQWIACAVSSIGLCADFGCVHSATLHPATRLMHPLHWGPMHGVQCNSATMHRHTHHTPGDRIKMHASFVSRLSLCLLSFFVFIINNQIVLGNWTTKRFLKATCIKVAACIWLQNATKFVYTWYDAICVQYRKHFGHQTKKLTIDKHRSRTTVFRAGKRVFHFSHAK